MKRLLSVILSLVLFTAFIPSLVSAESNAAILFNETFNGAITNSLPSSAIMYGDGSLGQSIVEDGRKILRIRNQWETTIVQFLVNIQEYKELVIENRVRVSDNNAEKDLLQYANDSQRFTLVTRKADGTLYDMNGARIGTMPTDKWMKLSAVINLETLKYELYIDGELVVHRGVLKDPSNITKVCITSNPNEAMETTTCCDWYRVYTGDKLLSDDYFPSVAMNQNVKNTKMEHASKPEYRPSLVFEADFNSGNVGEGVNSMPIYVQKAAITTDTADKENQVFRMDYKKGSGALVGAFIRVETYPSFVIQCDVRVNKKSKAAWNIRVCDSQTGGAVIIPIYILSNGKITASDQNTSLTKKNVKDGWVNVAAVMDFRTKDIDYYVDGELVLENYPFDDRSLSSSLYEIRISPTQSGITGDHYLEIDDLFMYKGIAPASKDELLGGGSAVASGDIIDYELNTSPLNPNMKAFSLVSDAKSVQKNPSSYLTDYSKTKEHYKDAICVVANNSNVWVKNGKYTSDYKFHWDGTHILGPAPTLAAFMNEKLSYDAATGVAKIGKITAKAGDEFITVDGKEYPSESKVQVIDGVLYIPVREFVRYGMNKFYGESTKGFGVIAPNERDYTYQLNAGGGGLAYSVANYSHMMAYLILDRLNAESIQALYDERIKGTQHPRLLTMKKDAPMYKSATQTDPRMKEFSDNVLREAKDYLNKSLHIPDVPGVQINGIPSINLPEQMYYAYYMTGDRAYIDKVIEYAKYLLNLENWNGDAHMLSTSWICLYLANTYDIFYDELGKSLRDQIVDACTEKAIKIHQKYMYGIDWNNWPVMDYNWNVICNTGPILASMIFLGDGYDDALFLDTIEKGQVSLGYFMHYFAPDGGGWETMGYTNYILSYFIPLLDGINNYFKDDLGFMQYPGIEKVGTFLVNTTGVKNGIPLHSDTGNTPITTALSLWFTKRNGDYVAQQRNVEQLYKDMPQYHIQGYSMMRYYMPNPPEVKTDEEDLDMIYRGVELGVSRDVWGDKGQAFIGVHGGANNAAHSQYDMGTFFFEANGEVWANDLGRENYSLQGSVYADRAEGHNLYVVNPNETAGQNRVATTTVKIHESKPKGVIYALDLNPAYYGMVADAKRAYMLSEDRKIFTVQDEIVPFDGEDEFYWFWHTAADIEIDHENKMVWLTLNNKKCAVYFDSNVEFLIDKQDVLTPLTASPKVEGQLQEPLHKIMKKISINFLSAGEPVYFRAVAVPYGQKWERTPITPYKEWVIPDGNCVDGYMGADMIYINGQPINGFETDRYDYSMYYPSYNAEPEIKVDTKGKVAEIIGRTENNKTVVVRIESTTDPGKFRNYTITLVDMYLEGTPNNADEVSIVNAVASDNDGNVPTNVFDNSLDTRWSSANEQWITLDLGAVKEFDSLALNVYSDDGRMLRHEILISDDNENFTQITPTMLSLGTTDWQYKELGKQKARYIKIKCNGSTIVPYNSIEEIKVFNSRAN